MSEDISIHVHNQPLCHCNALEHLVLLCKKLTATFIKKKKKKRINELATQNRCNIMIPTHLFLKNKAVLLQYVFTVLSHLLFVRLRWAETEGAECIYIKVFSVT